MKLNTVPSNLRIFSTTYLIIVKKYFMRQKNIYIYLKSARGNLQNFEKILAKTFKLKVLISQKFFENEKKK
jgi:hypothetical protein